MTARRQKVHDRHTLLHWANILSGEPRNNVDFNPNTRAGYYFRVLKDALRSGNLKAEYLDIPRLKNSIIARDELGARSPAGTRLGRPDWPRQTAPTAAARRRDVAGRWSWLPLSGRLYGAGGVGIPAVGRR